MASVKDNSNNPVFVDILKDISFESTTDIKKPETGLKIAKRIYSMNTGQVNSFDFFTRRWAHFEELEKWALGKQDMQQFLPFMNIVDANKSYARIDMTPIMLGAQFVGTKIESIAKNDEYPCVTAIDDDSQNKKEQDKLEALFRMQHVQEIHALQQQSGIQLEPTNAYVPDDELSAKVYFELEHQLPTEMEFEKILSNTLISNDYNRVLKPRLLRDNIVFNIECTKVEKEGKGKYYIRRCLPKNVFYNFILSDSGKNELRWIGEGYNLKVSDIRSKWGMTSTNPNGLTEEQIYNFARKSAQNMPANPMGFNYQFSQQYSLFTGNTPWDDFSGYVIDFEIKITDNDYFVSKIDNYGKENIAPKKSIPKPTSDKATIQKKEKERWYRCVYAPFADILIYWGKSDLTILDYTNTETAFCSYSINIPNNNGEYAPSLFERALEPLKEYALAKLKRKLLLSKLSPQAYRVDVESARNITTGTGASMDWEEIVRIKDTTGVELWSSKGLDPLTQSSPTFSAATADPTLGNIVQLSELLAGIEAEIRVLLGVPVYLDGSVVGDRTPASLASGQTTSAFNVTGFIPNSHTQVIEETLNKICTLSWQDMVAYKKLSADNLINTRFRTSVKMKMSDYEKQLLEADIQRYSQVPDKEGNPSLTLKDAMMIRNIANYKLAIWYLASTVESNRQKAIEDSQRLQEQNAQVQQQSAQQAQQEQLAMQQQEMADKKEMMEFEYTQKKQLALVDGFLMCASKGAQIPTAWLPVLQNLIPNITIPMVQENHEMVEEAQAEQAHQQAHNYAMQQAQGGGQQPQQGQPQQGQATQPPDVTSQPNQQPPQ